MKKDKRGLALITAIAVLALMLILFGGLASVYSAQVSRGKVELEQSQAMLMAQSYAEMLDQVLTSTNGEADGLKEKLGEIRTGKEVEIESDLTQPQNVIDAKVKITATAERETVSGNTTTRKIKIKVSATVDDETRSIDLDYTFKKVTGGGVMDYAVYGNTVDFYDTENHYEKKDNEQYRQEVIFSDDWYYIKTSTGYPVVKEEIMIDDSEKMLKEILYKYGKVVGEDKLFTVKKDGIINPLDSDFTTFGMAVNKNDSSAELPLWSGLYEPDDTVPVCTTEITASCIWDDRLKFDINVTSSTEDIIIYMPIHGELELEKTTINFDNGFTEGKANQLYIYMYSTGNAGKIELEDTLKIANIENGNRSDFLDIFVICNDEIEIEISKPKDSQMVLEAYFYFPKATVILEAQGVHNSDNNNYSNRIRGCLVADEIVILGHDNGNKKFNRVGIEYVPPREIQGGGSSKTTFTYKLNSYEEGGKS